MRSLPFFTIIGAITNYSEQLKLPRKIYCLGAEAVQKQIDWIPYPENVDMHKYYSKMADWYSHKTGNYT